MTPAVTFYCIKYFCSASSLLYHVDQENVVSNEIAPRILHQWQLGNELIFIHGPIILEMPFVG